jgi:hypothetical protein
VLGLNEPTNISNFCLLSKVSWKYCFVHKGNVVARVAYSHLISHLLVLVFQNNSEINKEKFTDLLLRCTRNNARQLVINFVPIYHVGIVIQK